MEASSIATDDRGFRADHHVFREPAVLLLVSRAICGDPAAEPVGEEVLITRSPRQSAFPRAPFLSGFPTKRRALEPVNPHVQAEQPVDLPAQVNGYGPFVLACIGTLWGSQPQPAPRCRLAISDEFSIDHF